MCSGRGCVGVDEGVWVRLRACAHGASLSRARVCDSGAASRVVVVRSLILKLVFFCYRCWRRRRTSCLFHIYFLGLLAMLESQVGGGGCFLYLRGVEGTLPACSARPVVLSSSARAFLCLINPRNAGSHIREIAGDRGRSWEIAGGRGMSRQACGRLRLVPFRYPINP